MFETGRIHFHRRLGRHPRDEGVRWLVAAITLNYLAEGHFPEPITIATGFSRVGNTSWTLHSAAFQEKKCIATCETVLVAQGPAAGEHISEMAALDRTLWFAGPQD
jgi:acyl-CoA thioester hydrolase